MDAAEFLGLLSRWAHILAAIVLVGGTLFLRLVVVPSRGTDASDDELKRAMRSRWSRLVGITAALLIVSGIYNLVIILKADQAPAPGTYHVLLLVKLLLALAIFFLASVLAGRSSLAQKFQQKERFWLNVVAVLAVVLVCIAGAMKNSPRQPKELDDAEQAAIEIDPLRDAGQSDG